MAEFDRGVYYGTAYREDYDDALMNLKTDTTMVYTKNDDPLVRELCEFQDTAFENLPLELPSDMVGVVAVEDFTEPLCGVTVMYGAKYEVFEDESVNAADSRVFPICGGGRPDGFILAVKEQTAYGRYDTFLHELAHAEDWYRNGFTSEQHDNFQEICESFGVGHTLND